jgi:hypothetical protein
MDSANIQKFKYGFEKQHHPDKSCSANIAMEICMSKGTRMQKYNSDKVSHSK